MKKILLALVLCLLPSAVLAANFDIFSPYSSVTKTGFKAANTYSFTDGIVGVKIYCTGAGIMKINNQTVLYPPIAATTEYAVTRGKHIRFIAVSSAASNTCKYQMHKVGNY
jgi:hypothetical protein